MFKYGLIKERFAALASRQYAGNAFGICRLSDADFRIYRYGTYT